MSADRIDMMGQIIGHYRVSGKLGAGGMGEVYRATDERLGREVALKVLPPSLHKDPAALERFQREARAASALNHPNIAVIYDIGEHEQQPYLVMELLEGVTIRERISIASLTVDEVFDAAIQIADALDAAHVKGIVHRDIKPANLFLTSRGTVKMLDFGLAKMVLRGGDATMGGSATLDAREQHLTSPGTALGTVAYMSPEQARGELLDARTDLFSFGAVLYEMATRRQAFAGDTSAIVFDAILNRQPTEIGREMPSFPSGLKQVIAKLLEKDRDLRYQSAADVRADLKRLKRDSDSGRVKPASSSGKVRAPRAAISKAIDSLAVLPFENASGDPENEYLSDGIAETIINTLSKLRTLRVVPRGIAFRYKGKSADPFEAAAELNVRAVVSGRVQKYKDKIIIKAELVDVVRQDQLWGDQFHRGMDDLLDVQDEIASEIARHLEQKLGGAAGKKTEKRSKVDSEAYRLYLLGVHHAYLWKEENLRTSIDLFQQSIAVDASYAPSYAGLAYSLSMMGFYGFLPPVQAYVQAKSAAQKSVSLDPRVAEAYVGLGWVAMMKDRQPENARENYLKAIELNPNLAVAHHGLAIHYNMVRKPDQALVEIRRAVELDPLTSLFQAHYGWILHCLGRDAESLAMLQAALDTHPNDYYVLRIMIYVASLAGHPELSIDAGERVAAATVKKPLLSQAVRAFAHAIAGKPDARELYEKLGGFDPNDSSAAYYQSMTATLLGDHDRALDFLEFAMREGLGLLAVGSAEPTFDPLRNQPRFKKLMAEMGLPH